MGYDLLKSEPPLIEVSVNGGSWQSLSNVYGNYLIPYSISSGYQALDYLSEQISINLRFATRTDGNIEYNVSEGLKETFAYTVKKCLTYGSELNYISILNDEYSFAMNVKTKITDDNLLMFLKIHYYDENDQLHTEWAPYIFFMQNNKIYMKKLTVTEEAGSYYYFLSNVEEGKFKITASGRATDDRNEEGIRLDVSETYNWVNVSSGGLELNNFTIIHETDGNRNIACFYVMLTETETTTDSIFSNKNDYFLYYTIAD